MHLTKRTKVTTYLIAGLLAAAGLIVFSVPSIRTAVLDRFSSRATELSTLIAPTNLSLRMESSNEPGVYLTWNDNSENPEEEAFVIERSEYEGNTVWGPYSQIVEIPTKAAQQPEIGVARWYVDSNDLKEGFSYKYRVVAVKAQKKSGFSNEAGLTVNFGGLAEHSPGPASREGRVQPASENEIMVEWAHADSYGYEVRRNGLIIAEIYEPDEAVIQIFDSNLDPETEYCYEIREYAEVGEYEIVSRDPIFPSVDQNGCLKLAGQDEVNP